MGTLSSSTANLRAAQSNCRAFGCQELHFLNFVTRTHRVRRITKLWSRVRYKMTICQESLNLKFLEANCSLLLLTEVCILTYRYLAILLSLCSVSTSIRSHLSLSTLPSPSSTFSYSSLLLLLCNWNP